MNSTMVFLCCKDMDYVILYYSNFEGMPRTKGKNLYNNKNYQVTKQIEVEEKSHMVNLHIVNYQLPCLPVSTTPAVCSRYSMKESKIILEI